MRFNKAYLKCIYFILLIFSTVVIEAQELQQFNQRGNDPCGYPDTTTFQYRIAAALNWGYGYTDLLRDIDQWKQSSYVRSEIAGSSVQNRQIYLLTITSPGSDEKRKRIWIHARTHPSEVEGTYVTNEMIKYLLTENTLAKKLRDSCVFNIIPMINPDGVELKKPRENANGINIESNWNTFPHQSEVDVLNRQFNRFMQSPSPIRVALNMHSAYDCLRYFVYHASAGSSELYTQLEQKYISDVQTHFPGGFQEYNYFVSWTGATPLQYPESWFWINYHESVLAMTYEDMNCTQHGDYDKTAYAILAGIADYLNVKVSSDTITQKSIPISFDLGQNYPNPFSQMTIIPFSVPGTINVPDKSQSKSDLQFVTLKIFDSFGREIQTIFQSQVSAGEYHFRFNPNSLSRGTYYYQLTTRDQIRTRAMIFLK